MGTPETGRRVITFAAVVVLSVLAIGCTTGRSGVTISYAPRDGLTFDEPVDVVVRGLHAGRLATIRFTTHDDEGITWTSEATFTASPRGTIDLNAVAPQSGSYAGVAEMGLFWSVQPSSKPTREINFNSFGELDVFVAGRKVVSTGINRSIVSGSGGFLHKTYTVSDYGFDAQYFPTLTRPTPGKHTGVVVLGGSEGESVPDRLGELLAAHGYPTLLLAYFRAPGLPQELSSIPLEYFARAITWFSHQDQVDPHRIVVMGISRGSEAALLLGADYPELVHGVVAAVPSNVVHCARPVAPPPTPVPSSWTFHGHPVPCTNSDSAHPYDAPASVIPVERIDGPVFAYCGEADTTWPSCPYTETMFSRLQAHSRRWHDVLTRFPGAGHFVGYTLPYEPVPASFVQSDKTYVADRQSLVTVWAQLLGFLARFGPARIVISSTPTA